MSTLNEVAQANVRPEASCKWTTVTARRDGKLLWSEKQTVSESETDWEFPASRPLRSIAAHSIAVDRDTS